MDDPDLDLRQPYDDRPTSFRGRGPRTDAVIAVVVLIALLVGGVVLYLRRQGDERSATAAPAAAAATESARPLGAAAEPIAVPPLDQSDEFVRGMIAKLTSDPRLLAWLASDGLIRTFVVVVDNVADGETPSRQLRMMRPLSEFRVSPASGRASIDPRSYERYSAIAEAAASVDAKGSAQLYTTLKPRIEEAYRELGYPDTPFDSTLERAFIVLLSTPISDGPVPVVPARGTAFAFADARLEGLNGAQKQLLRTGPRNARMIQGALREIALALGIPDARLPRVQG
jgi:hypothetical protein